MVCFSDIVLSLGLGFAFEVSSLCSSLIPPFLASGLLMASWLPYKKIAVAAEPVSAEENVAHLSANRQVKYDATL